jgi:hypothetical protein
MAVEIGGRDARRSTACRGSYEASRVSRGARHSETRVAPTRIAQGGAVVFTLKCAAVMGTILIWRQTCDLGSIRAARGSKVRLSRHRRLLEVAARALHRIGCESVIVGTQQERPPNRRNVSHVCQCEAFFLGIRYCGRAFVEIRPKQAGHWSPLARHTPSAKIMPIGLPRPSVNQHRLPGSLSPVAPGASLLFPT